MKKLITGTMVFLFLLMGFVAFQSVQGAAAAPSIKAGVACSGLGESRIADDRSMILACVLQNSGTAATACGVGSPCLWKPMNPVIMDTAGNIGVGTATPAAKLDVAGSANVAGAATVAGAANVGGGLSVGSGVKMGNDGAACTAAKEGTQRYNSGTKKMEFCDGTNPWKAMGDTGGAFGGMYGLSAQFPPSPPGIHIGASNCSPGTPFCHTTNPLTGACSCPSGFTERVFEETYRLLNGVSCGFINPISKKVYCYKP